MRDAAASGDISLPNLELDTRSFCDYLRDGFLAASPRAAILADPCVCVRPERIAGQLFAFSDIPDSRFRKPREIIHLSQSYVSGGIKS